MTIFEKSLKRTESVSPDDLLALYLQDIGRIPPTEDWEEKEIGQSLQDPFLSEEERVGFLNRLVTGNLRLPVHIATRIFPGASLPTMDLIQVGNEVLMAAAQRYDPEKGKFGTYAWQCIIGTLIRELQERGQAIRLPQSVYQDASFIEEQIEEAKRQVGDNWGQVALRLGMTAGELEAARQRIAQVKAVTSTISLDEERVFWDEEAGQPTREVFDRHEDLADSSQDVFSAISQKELGRILRGILSSKAFSDLEREIIRLRFEEEKTLQEIANQFGVTKEAIRWREREVIKKLRHPQLRKRFQDFLRG